MKAKTQLQTRLSVPKFAPPRLSPTLARSSAEVQNDTSRKFKAIVATESPVVVFDWESGRPIEEVLIAKGGAFPKSAPLLDSHMRMSAASVVGAASQFERDGQLWRGTIDVSAADDISESIYRKINAGHVDSVSIGYQVLESATIPAGKSELHIGRTWTAGKLPLRLTKRWQVHELSVVAIGADPVARITGKRCAVANEEKTHSYFR